MSPGGFNDNGRPEDDTGEEQYDGTEMDDFTVGRGAGWVDGARDEEVPDDITGAAGFESAVDPSEDPGGDEPTLRPRTMSIAKSSMAG